MASNRYSFGSIQPVPPLNDFLDIVLSKTQRKTPTVIHKGYAIGRIRDFYLRKVKFTRDTFDEKLGAILEEFPRLDDVHPFYADLMNILYDKDHYKLALGQINTARHLIDTVGKEYAKLIKFGDSLYRCKQLKRAALGRMATIMKRQRDTLIYLEQVRQHLSRLPCIDPNTRTLLVCGFPNVGKSSFMNKLTRAEVDVQPYAFTTKSLFVGHMDYKYLRWQVIDTPGILDHPLEERNTIEMQSITALAHLRACVLFFIDISATCGFSISQQVTLFNSIKPLFANKPILVVLNKVDLVRPDDIAEEDKALLQVLMNEGHEFAQSSCVTDEGVMGVRNLACEKLLAQRVDLKMKGQRINDVLNRLHLTTPQARDDKSRPPCIPEAVLARRAVTATGIRTEPRRLARDIEVENGGPGVYNVNLKNNYLLREEAWKMDTIPELLDGRNIADFIDPEIEERLLRLEAEEEALEASGAYDESAEALTEEQREIRKLARQIKDRKRVLSQETRLTNKNISSRPVLVPRIKQNKRAMVMAEENLSDEAMDVSDHEDGSSKKRLISKTRAVSIPPTGRDRSVLGLRTDDFSRVTKLKRDAQVRRNRDARKGEADRRVLISRPKHLFSGKRGMGTNDRR